MKLGQFLNCPKLFENLKLMNDILAKEDFFDR